MIVPRMKVGTVILPVLALLLLLTLNYAVSARYDALEFIYEYSRAHEDWELDEMFTLVISVVIYLLAVSMFLWWKASANAEKLHLRTKELEDALKEIKQLKEMLPICSYCKKIRDENDEWHEIDHYIADHTDTRFSHSICPDCESIHFPDLDSMDDDD